jgi:hypothetical protein
MDNRIKQAMIATELQTVLGSDYTVRFDDCDSGLTRVYYKPLNKLLAEVPNETMTAGINFTSFTASAEDRAHARVIKAIR